MRITQHDARQPRPAIDRPLNPPDRDAQPIVQFVGRDNIGNQAMPDRRIQPDQQGRRRAHNPQRQAQRIFAPAQPAAHAGRVLLRRFRLWLFLNVRPLRHQNACPSAT